jgi:hypothetical protein
MRGWVGVNKVPWRAMAELLMVQAKKAILLPQAPALLTQTGFQPFSVHQLEIFCAMIDPSAILNLENYIETTL